MEQTIPSLHKTIHKLKKLKRILPNSLYKGCITLIPKPKPKISQEKKVQINYLMDLHAEVNKTKQNFNKWNLAIYKR